MTIGDRIRERRAAKKLTLQQVGEHFGINRASVSDWENNKTRPDLDKVVGLARLLGTTTDYLLSGRKVVAGEWPLQGVSPEEWDALSSSDRDDVSAIARHKVERNGFKRSGAA